MVLQYLHICCILMLVRCTCTMLHLRLDKKVFHLMAARKRRMTIAEANPYLTVVRTNNRSQS